MGRRNKRQDDKDRVMGWRKRKEAAVAAVFVVLRRCCEMKNSRCRHFSGRRLFPKRGRASHRPIPAERDPFFFFFCLWRPPGSSCREFLVSLDMKGATAVSKHHDCHCAAILPPWSEIAIASIDYRIKAAACSQPASLTTSLYRKRAVLTIERI